jgi:hypothetical protein
MHVSRRVLVGVLVVMLTTVGSALAQQAPDEQVEAAPTGLVGRVVLATRCPVPVGDADDGVCPTPAFPSTLAIRSADGSTEVARVATDQSGTFSVPLDPGLYLVEAPATAAGPPRVQTLAVTVAADGPTPLVIRVPVGFGRLP